MTLTHLPAAVADAIGADDRERLEEALLRTVRTAYPSLTDVASYLSAKGGKRLRPALVVAASRIGRPAGDMASDRAIMAGVAVELMHLGSLYHDDVIDEAEVRRGSASVNARWDNATAVLGGDLLLARASQTALSLGLEHARVLSDALDRLVTGQTLELQDQGNPERTPQSYFDSIAGKTAALTTAACRLGAMEANLGPLVVDSLSRFGHHYGMAFQVVDDVLDLVATAELLGKPVGNDIREGVFTLPVLLAAASDAALAETLVGELTDGEVDKAVEACRASGGVAAAMAVATDHVAAAEDELRRAGVLDEAWGGVLLRLARSVVHQVEPFVGSYAPHAEGPAVAAWASSASSAVRVS